MHRTGLRSASTTSGDLPEQEREAQDQLAQRLAIEQSAAAEPVQLSDHALGGVDQLVGFCVGDRQQAERNPSAEAGLAPAEADREHWAEIGIADGADEHVRAAGRDEAAGRSRRSIHVRQPAPVVRARRQPDRSADSPSNPSSTASMSLACSGAARVRLERHRSADLRRHRDRALDIAAAMQRRQPRSPCVASRASASASESQPPAGSRSRNEAITARAAAPSRSG